MLWMPLPQLRSDLTGKDSLHCILEYNVLIVTINEVDQWSMDQAIVYFP